MQDDEGPQLCPTLVIISLTSQLTAARFSHTVPLNPSPHSGLRVPSLALAAQVPAVDRTRLRQQLGPVTADQYEQVRTALISMVTPH
jgi:mRNA-degrading endonuclease toxin of MazEF toxin-antitoxin module